MMKAVEMYNGPTDIDGMSKDRERQIVEEDYAEEQAAGYDVWCKEQEAKLGRPAWIHDGIRVLYTSSPGRDYAGTIDGESFLIGGHTWVVHLRGMEPGYRNGERSTVSAAACHCIRPL